jgi:putative transposase
MPRKARINAAGQCFHVMSRGIEGRDIFADDDDRNSFLRYLAEGLKRTGFQCYAWALMPNHYHLLVRTSEQVLAALMRRLNSKYAQYFGKKHRRCGYLFQDRFRSIATQDQNYVEEIVRYIHLNPIRAGICPNLDQLESYPWTGHSALMGKYKNNFQNIDAVLRRFGKNKPQARARYRTFLMEGIGPGNESEIISKIRNSNRAKEQRGASECWVIGDENFVKGILKLDKGNRMRLSRYAREGWDLDRLSTVIEKHMGINREELHRRCKGGPASDAKKALTYIAYRVLGIPVKDVARFLGIGGPAVSMMLDDEEEITKQSELAKLIN